MKNQEHLLNRSTQRTQRSKSGVSSNNPLIHPSINPFSGSLRLSAPSCSIFFSLATFITYLTFASSALGQGSAFTYQGRLNDGAAPAIGIYEMQFSLHDAVANGNLVGAAVSLAPVAVSNGLFTVSLDFGSSAFSGAPRWLEITVNVYGSDRPAIVLSPRQPITVTPYAIRAANFSGPITDTQLSGNVARLNASQTFSGSVQFANPSNTFAGTFTGNGTGVTNVSLARINSQGAIAPADEPTFTLGALLEVGSGPSSLAGADVNNDGRVDLICANYWDGTLSVLTNNSKPGFPVTFALASTPVANPYGTPCRGLRTLAATNANGDAYIDFICGSWRMPCGSGGAAAEAAMQSAVSCGGQGTVTVLTNDGSGGFSKASWEFLNYYPQWPSYTSVRADLNGDEHQDLISVPAWDSCEGPSSYDHTVSVFLNLPFSFFGSFTGNGRGLTDLNASNITLGTLPTAALDNAWKIGGNAGTIPGAHFIGTTDYKPLELKVDGQRSFRVEPASSDRIYVDVNYGAMVYDSSPNIIAGSYGNWVSQNVLGATIAGGGVIHIQEDCVDLDCTDVNITTSFEPNHVSASFGTVAGGFGNASSGYAATVSGGTANTSSNAFATVPGGDMNTAGGAYSLAAGRRAKALHDGSFVWGDSTDVDIESTAVNQFTIRATGGVRFLMTPEASGAELAPGSGAWSTLSDRNAKTNFAAANPREILEKVAILSLATWNYKAQDKSIRHIGPTAQDFHAAFGLGENERTITTVDADGIALAAIQGLNQKLEEQVKAKEAQIKSLERRLQKIENLLNNVNTPAEDIR